MKDMASMSPTAGFYGNMPDSLNIVVNVSHPLIKSVIDEKGKELGVKIDDLDKQIKPLEAKVDDIKKKTKVGRAR